MLKANLEVKIKLAKPVQDFIIMHFRKQQHIKPS